MLHNNVPFLMIVVVAASAKVAAVEDLASSCSLACATTNTDPTSDSATQCGLDCVAKFAGQTTNAAKEEEEDKCSASAAVIGLAAEGDMCLDHSDCGLNHCGYTVAFSTIPAKCCCRGYWGGSCYALEVGSPCGYNSQCESGICNNDTGVNIDSKVCVVAIEDQVNKSVTADDFSGGLEAAYLSSQVYNLESAARAGTPVENMSCFPVDAEQEGDGLFGIPLWSECENRTTYFDTSVSAYGYTAKLGSKLVAVFAGTDAGDGKDLKVDLISATTTSVQLGPDKVWYAGGRGFIQQYESLRAKGFNPAALCTGNVKQHVLVTGHSLGGAVANLAAIDLFLHGCSVELVTFGCPRVFINAYVILAKSMMQEDIEQIFGREVFANDDPIFGSTAVQAMIEDNAEFTARRWVNEGDGVPSLPPSTYLGFQHVATDVISLHHMWWYKKERTFSFEAQDYSAYNLGVSIGYYHLMTSLGGDSAVNGYIPRILEGAGHVYTGLTSCAVTFDSAAFVVVGIVAAALM